MQNDDKKKEVIFREVGFIIMFVFLAMVAAASYISYVEMGESDDVTVDPKKIEQQVKEETYRKAPRKK